MADSTLCSDASIADRLIRIIAYDGSVKDITINYTLLLINVFVAASTLTPSITTTTPEILLKRRHALLSFAFGTYFILMCAIFHLIDRLD